MKKIFFLILTLSLFALPRAGLADSAARQTLEGNITKITAILEEKGSRTEAKKKETQDKLMAVIAPFFDWAAMSQRALGLAWKQMSPEQQGEFAELFKKLLAKVYMSRLLSYQGEKVVYGKESAASDKLTEIQTRVQSTDKEIPIDYRLLLKNNEWRVYDVVVEGVSLASNYRSQFSEFLTNKTVAELLANLRQKVKE